MAEEETVVVTVTQGALKGRKRKASTACSYYSFQGVPYAKPPVGALRFKAPQPPERWAGIRDALKEAPLAAQPPTMVTKVRTMYKNIREKDDDIGILGEEDCLYLNIYTPKLPADGGEKMPVMFFIHGGCYFKGTAKAETCGPDYLMPQNVLLVSVNYRLGVFGFISTGDSVVQGNNGLKDQVLALRWVQENISQFGGDPGNVTIFGCSSGGGSVHYLMLSPMSKGLFHRAIAESGCALNPWSYLDPQVCRQRIFRLVETLGYFTCQSSILLSFLQEVSANDLVDATIRTITEQERHPFHQFFGPTKEAKGGEEEIFLPDDPINIIKSGNFSQVPFIIGVNSVEGSPILGEYVDFPEWYNSVYDNCEPVLCLYFNRKPDSEAVKVAASKIKKFYYEGKRRDDVRNHVEFYGDLLFISGIYKVVELHAAISTTPVYLYNFCYEGTMGFGQLLYGEDRKKVKGACHGDEHTYLLHMSHHPELSLDPEGEEMMMSKRMVKMWANFARTGNPTPEQDPDLSVTWKPVTKSEFCYLNIDSILTMETGTYKFYQERINLWNEIMSILNQ